MLNFRTQFSIPKKNIVILSAAKDPIGLLETEWDPSLTLRMTCCPEDTAYQVFDLIFKCSL